MIHLLTIYICVGSACHLKSSYNILLRLQEMIEERRLSESVEVKAALCLGKCSDAVSARIEDGEVISLSLDNVDGFFNKEVMEELKKQPDFRADSGN